MKLLASLFAPALAGLMALAGPDAGAASSAVELTSVGNTFQTNGRYTLGFEFMVTEAVQVVSLGVFDGGAPGLMSAATVSLWSDDQTGSLLATAQVAAGSGAPWAGQFRYAAIGPVTLQPGTIYVVGAYLPEGEATGLNMGDGSSVGSFDARLTGVVDRYWDDGQDFPLGSMDLAGAAWLGANFQLAAVPEPDSAALLAFGLLAGAVSHRRRVAGGRRAPST